MRGFAALLLLCFLAVVGLAQTRSLTAVKATHAPKIDGQLDDAAWADAPEATDFVQYYPAYGHPATKRSRIKILYDDEAVYIGAYLYEEPRQVHTQFTNRDAEQQQDVDYFSVFFDTYRDQQNGFQFLVTSANVQTDARLAANLALNYGEYGDKTWDAVWESKTRLQPDGWTAELRIPYISLRFAKRDVQTWGLQFLRFSRHNNESDFWSPVNPNTAGFVNQFGLYGDLKNIQPPLRLSFSPYLSGGLRRSPRLVEGKTQFNNEWLRSGGMDVKYGINESFTLDATLIPDFGQVVSDNVVNNLTPYEVKFTENRPFFTEGTELFNKAGLFYSRRIGATPTDYYQVHAYANSDTNLLLRKNPGITQLYNAIKLSGRTNMKLGIGIFNAVSAPMHAEIEDKRTSSKATLLTEPLTNYNILVLDQAFTGQSYLTFTNTNVIRNGANRDANVAALNFAAYDRTNTYSLSGGVRYSKIFGLTPYSIIEATPYRYIAALDTISVDGRTYVKPYDGFRSTVSLGKVSGKVQYAATVNVESAGYDPNDLGFIEAPNEVSYLGTASYNQYTPTNNFISYNYNLRLTYNRMYQPNASTNTELRGSGSWVFKNFWDVTVELGAQPFWQTDYFELQTANRFVKKPPYWFLSFEGSTDSRKRLYLSYNFGLADGGVFADNMYFNTAAGLRYRFSQKFSLSLDLERQHDNLQIGYAFVNINNQPILGFRNVKVVTSVLSGNYNFTPRMNITLRARHYWNTVKYLSFHDVKRDGYYTDRAFMPGLDQNFNIFNLDAFYTWDFRPGSRVIVGYKNSLGDDYLYDLYGKSYERFGRNLIKSFQLPHGNELTLRFIYFLDYNQLRKL